MANRREKVEIVRDFPFLDSKITVDGDCSHETRRQLVLGRKAMTNLDSVLKSRDRCKEKTIGLCGRRQGWNYMRE